MIITGGENVYPAEIERVLMSDAGITEAAVVRVTLVEPVPRRVVVVGAGDEGLRRAVRGEVGDRKAREARASGEAGGGSVGGGGEEDERPEQHHIN